MLKRHQNGMTLMEILAVLLILAVLAAVLYPAVAVQIRKGQSTAIADQLTNLREALSNYHENVTRYPSTLTQLTQAAGAVDICGFAIPAGLQNRWVGPYIAQNIVGNMPVGDATVQNALARNPPDNSGGPTGLLQILVTDVEQNSATDLEQQFDGNNNFATGTILWAGGTLTFQIPIRNC